MSFVDCESVKKSISSLSANDSEKSKMDRFAEVAEEIEAAMKRGVSQAEIVDALKRSGLEMTVDLLRNYRNRMKKGNKKGGKNLEVETPKKLADGPIKKQPPRLFEWQNDKNENLKHC